MGRTIVIGAGVSGLAAAVELDKAGEDFLLFEQSDAVGGAMRSHRSDGWVFEDGPTSVFDSDGTFAQFCSDLGIVGEIVEARPEARARWIFHEGALASVPSSPGDLLRSPLLTLSERVRFLREAFIKPGTADVEETVSAFLERRFGRRVSEKFAGAIVSGIYAGDPGRLSIDAAFPEIRAIEREHGSLLSGAGKQPRGRRRLLSLAQGMGRIGAACHARLGSRVRTQARVEAIGRPEGQRVSLTVECGGVRERLHAEVVVVATAAPAAAKLVASLAPAAADGLSGIEHSSLAVVQLGLGMEAAARVPAGFGFLVPRGAGIESLGWIFLSRVFDGRAPEGSAALMGFFGGSLAPGSLALGDHDLGELAVREIGRAIGLRSAPPVEIIRVVRWKDALPQYNVGHGQRIEAAMTHLGREAAPIVLAGNYLAGISVPRCIASGRDAARHALARLGARA